METVKTVSHLEELEHPLTDEQRRVIRDGGMAAQFIGSPYWVLFQSRIEAQCRMALQSMFECESSDDHVIANNWRIWKAAEKQRQGLENYFMSLKDDYEAAQEESRQRQMAASLQNPADDLSGISDI